MFIDVVSQGWFARALGYFCSVSRLDTSVRFALRPCGNVGSDLVPQREFQVGFPSVAAGRFYGAVPVGSPV